MNVIDPLPFRLEPAVVAKGLHLREGSRQITEIERLIAEAEQLARPKALYRLCFIDSRTEDSVTIDGVTLTSRILRVNLGDLQRFFAFVVTSGRECEAWAESSDDVLERFYADAINQAVLKSAVAGFVAHLTEAYGLAGTAAMNPGSLPEWPITQQKPLFKLLGDVEGQIGVVLKPSYLMTPTKSVSGILFPSEETFASCQLCPRQDCPNRRAPYDPGLFERKYKVAGSLTPVAGDGSNLASELTGN